MFITRKELQQQAGTDGGAGGAGSGAAAGAGASGAAGSGAGAAAGAGGGAAAGGDKNGQQQGAGQQGTQQKTGTTTDDGKGTGDASQGKPTAFVPKLPEGMKFDEAILKEFNDIFADEKLSTAGRQQKLIDFQIKQAQVAQRSFQDRLAAQPGKDLESLRADKDFGGPNFQATVDGAKRIEQYAFGEELGKLLGPLGLQSNPVILKGLARLSRVIAEDAIGTSTGTQRGEDKDSPDAQGRAMFPNSWDKMQKEARKR